MITAGVDIGSLSANAVILKDNDILSYSNIRVGPDSAEASRQAMDEALEGTGLSPSDLEYIVATGYGRVICPSANKNITEISCHSMGAHWLFPTVRTVLDMGGQDCKAIRCNSTGKVTNFLMNEKCAAGTGRSIEVVASLFGMPLEEVGPLSLQISDGPVPISQICVIFAKSEILGLLRQGAAKNDILAGYCAALTQRIVGLLERTGIEKEVVISGGIAKNIGIVSRIEESLGLKALIPFEPQIVGALGAALFAASALEKQKGPPADSW